MVKFFVETENGAALAKAPKRAQGDAGFDFFIPNVTEKFLNDLYNKNQNSIARGNIQVLDKIYLEPGSDILIPSYVHSLLPMDVELEANEKSGVATKKKLLVGAKIVDPSYKGVIHMHLFNVGNEQVEMEFGEKIVQFVPKYFDNEEHQVIEGDSEGLEEFYKDLVSSRGDGGFGSTGTK